MLCWLREDEMSVQELLQRVQCVITHVDEIMQQEIRPLLAVDIIEQLHRQFALLSGGRGKDGAPIITFPEYSSFSEVPDDDFLNVVTYLTSIPSLDAASIGFIIIIDRRKDKWSSVKASLSRIAGAFPGNLQLVLVLRPSRFFQRAIADIGIKLHKDDFKMKIVMLNSLSDLHGYVDKGQLTRELGGSLEYCHSQWIHHRTAIENFAMTVKTTAQMLQKFGTDLAETELPNDVQCTKDLLTAHTDKHNNLKDELKLALKQGTTLLGCIKEQAAKSENHKLNPDETENQTTVERLLAQLDETENAFEQFWCKHHLKLEQCLQLRHFEQDFREVKVSLDSLGDSLTTLSVIGDCLARVEQLLTELKTLEEKAQPTLEKAQLHALHGDQLIQSNHYAVDSIRPKCVELRRVCDDFSNEAKKKTDVLSKSLQIHTGIEKVNQWCESGIYLLASQAVDKCQSQEGAESALTDIERFLESAEKNQLTELRNLHNQYEVVLSEDIKASVLKALKRLEDVQEMFEKRHVSLKRLSAKQTRPVQPVAPRPESSPKRPSLKNPSRTTGSQQPLARRTSDNSNSGKQQAEADPNKRKNIRKAKGGIKIEVMHEESQGGSTHVVVTNETEESLSNRRRHIMTELIETERLYVEELQSIMEGYFAELDNSELSHLTPPSLENKRDVLFGNLPEIYEFHNRTFLRELENCTEKPELVGTCFLKRKEELQVYEKYCQNKPRSEVLWRQCGDSLFFQECQKKLDHKLSLDAYLLKPVQRITKYQLMLKEMLKCSKSEGVAELEEALATMLDIIKSVNDSMHQIAITGFEGNLSELGKLLMQGSFNVWTDHKKGHSKVKDLARFKPMQRHLFLYDKMLLFCKKREETTDGHEKTPSYSFKHSLKMSAVGITENVKGDSKKFEVWYNGREEVYIIQAPSMDVKNMWVSEIRKVLTGQLEACREASQLNIYGAPMRNVRKLALRQSDSSSPESGFRRTNPSPNMRQKRVDVSANQSGHSVANARKRFTLQGLSNRRSLPAESAAKEAEVPRRFSLTSSLASSTSSSFATRRTKGPLSASIKSKRHEIKSDPTPFGYEDTLRGAMAAVGKRQSMISSTATAAGGTTVVPRSTSQPGWTQRRLPSMDTEDFETIPSSAEESSNSSEEEGNNKNGDSSRFRVQLTYDSRDSRDISLETGDLVQFLEEAENGHWLVKKLLTEETGLVPPRILQAASEGDIFTDLCTAALSDLDENEASTWESVSQDSR
ncbi:guanine nucleotide exchange factor DBS-like isoform X2 [Seriola lalandi dorsalis]|uniref:guanine nucleotide exchange factor DBS-like isoform X2 n=1 Tax=Seriola lalandi dorsalis TaxID=1841481 RepID=UPI000C6FB510|nr:guanine nucleotide exchange factor DBS-like isoform X2 [Seriola lalandi dorsalis]XP_056235369.1 guanine nucleotide exchange factor DBS isoform X2 [Seriola aureovittata]